MLPILELSIPVWLRYIDLKLSWRICKSNVKGGPPFHTFLQLFYKNFKVSVLSYNRTHYVSILKKIEQKLAQM